QFGGGATANIHVEAIRGPTTKTISFLLVRLVWFLPPVCPESVQLQGHPPLAAVHLSAQQWYLHHKVFRPVLQCESFRVQNKEHLQSPYLDAAVEPSSLKESSPVRHE